MKNILKSIGAVIAGFVTVAALSILTDRVLETTGVLPPPTTPEAYVTWMLVLAFLYRSAYTVLGGYVVAKLAPQNPMKHVIALMVVGGISGVLGAVAAWSFGHHWYPVLLAITGPFLVLFGGKQYLKRSHLNE